MTRAFDRDDDGYLDMDRFPDAEPDGEGGVVFEPPPPLPDSDWLAALAHAVNVPDDALATDDLLDVGGLDDAGADDLDPSVFSLDGLDAGSHAGSDWSAHDWPGSDDGADGSAQADGGADDGDSSSDSW